MARSRPDEALLKRLAAGLRLLLLDVDGVLTDGGIILVGARGEAKRFDVQDGVGVDLAHQAGIKVGVVTSRNSVVVARRASELKMDEVLQHVKRKREVLGPLQQKYGISPEQIAFVGDDLPDLSIMKHVGIPIAVHNAVQAVKECSVYVTSASGGYGAVREAVEWLLQLRADAQSSLLHRQ